MKKVIIGLLFLLVSLSLHSDTLYTNERPVKIWPFYYHEEDPVKDFEETDIMWPIFLKKREGEMRHFAMRPFYISKYNPTTGFRERDIFWPFCHFERGKSGTGGRIAPLFWYSIDYDERRGKEVDYRVLFPFWWQEEDYWVLVPLYGQGRDFITVLPPLFWKGREFIRIIPFWWDSAERLVIFPIFWKGPHYCVVVPLYGQGKDFMTVFPPLFWKVKDNTVVFPFWWQGENSITIFPVYWHGKDGWKKKFTVVFPLYWYREGRYWFVLPLGGRKGQGDRYTDFILWPLYSRKRADDIRTLNFIWPLISFKRGDKVAGSRFLPFYAYYKERSGSDYGDIYQNTSGFFLFYLFSKGKSISIDDHYTHESKTYGFFPFYWYDEYDKKRKDTVLKSREHTIFPLYWYERNEWPEEGVTSRSVDLYPIFTYDRWTNGTVRFSMFWPLWLHEWDEELFEEKCSILWRLWDHQEDKRGDIRTRVLWKLYIHEEKGDYKSTELMPVFTSETKGEEAKHFAIFWRFFEYERTGQEKSLRFFYLPKFPRWQTHN
jgi:hypothetical protein